MHGRYYASRTDVVAGTPDYIEAFYYLSRHCPRLALLAGSVLEKLNQGAD